VTITWDPIPVINLVLCAFIFALGVAGWRRTRRRLPLYIAIAFGLFGLSHLATILGLSKSLEDALIVVRTIAYLLVVFALYRLAAESNAARRQ
jgi:uncharacterized membrane protein YhfC